MILHNSFWLVYLGFYMLSIICFLVMIKKNRSSHFHSQQKAAISPRLN